MSSYAFCNSHGRTTLLHPLWNDHPRCSLKKRRNRLGCLHRPIIISKSLSDIITRKHRATTTTTKSVVTMQSYAASCVPEVAKEIEDEAAQAMFSRVQYTPIPTPEGVIIHTSHVISPCGVVDNETDDNKTDDNNNKNKNGDDFDDAKPVLIFLHGFDSNMFEYRYILPIMDAQPYECHFVDILGWGLTERPDRANFSYGPDAKRAHLESFINNVVTSKGFKTRRNLVLIGASIGGAVAIDLLLNSSTPIKKQISSLVLIDAQAFTDKRKSFITQLPGVSWLGSEILRSDWLRRQAARMSYTSTTLQTSEDVLKIGKLHCYTPRWKEATMEFIRGEGYCLSKRVGEINVDTLVLWGEDDRVLPKDDASKFKQTVRNCRLQFIKDCGHSPHIEKPSSVVHAILGFLLQTHQLNQQTPSSSSSSITTTSTTI